jgi:hypothetical protein
MLDALSLSHSAVTLTASPCALTPFLPADVASCPPHCTLHSAGKNCLSQLTATSYLVRFSRLELLNLAGNPLAQDQDYRSYVLSHLKHLRYLDYR